MISSSPYRFRATFRTFFWSRENFSFSRIINVVVSIKGTVIYIILWLVSFTETVIYDLADNLFNFVEHCETIYNLFSTIMYRRGIVKTRASEMSCFLNILSMDFFLSMKCLLWNVQCMKYPIYEISNLWNILSMKCPINEISNLWILTIELFNYEIYHL